MNTRPRGLAGVAPGRFDGVAVRAGIRNAKTGEPILTDRFWMMDPVAASKDYGSRKQLTSAPHPSFRAWNEVAKLGRDRVAAVRGNIVHARLPDAAWWRRGAQKLPEPHKNPASQRPACEGDGIRARRYSGVVDGAEVFQDIACPNELCPFAMNGKCKPVADLLFRLRWDKDDPFERQFPALIAHYQTHGWRTLRRMLGLFEFIIGTAAVAPFTPKEEWKAGLASELGLSSVSFVGMPFSMVISMQTIPARARKFPVVAFSHDGDMVAWLISQHRQRTMLGGGLPLALPSAPTIVEEPPISTLDEEFEVISDMASLAMDPMVYDNVVDAELEPEHPAAGPPPPEAESDLELATEPQPEAPAEEVQDLMVALKASIAAAAEKKARPVALLSDAKAAKLFRDAAAKGGEEALENEAERLAGTRKLTEVPAKYETDLMRFVARLPETPR